MGKRGGYIFIRDMALGPDESGQVSTHWPRAYEPKSIIMCADGNWRRMILTIRFS